MICLLFIDMIEKVNLGYLGMLMGVVLMVYMLFVKYLVFNLVNLEWFNCDCFVLLVGYGFVLFYSMFYLFGYDVKMEDLK